MVSRGKKRSKEPAWMSTKPPWLLSWGEAFSARKTEYASVPQVSVSPPVASGQRVAPLAGSRVRSPSKFHAIPSLRKPDLGGAGGLNVGCVVDEEGHIRSGLHIFYVPSPPHPSTILIRSPAREQGLQVVLDLRGSVDEGGEEDITVMCATAGRLFVRTRYLLQCETTTNS